jgi:predicted MarR family transcription regulator
MNQLRDDEDMRAAADRLSELEFSMIVAANGFWNWVVHCAQAAGARGLGTLDILVLHAINRRARGRKLSDICLVLNVEDSHTVAYSLRKLEEQGYATHEQQGRDRTYSTSPDGDAFCERYHEVRRRALVESLADDGARLTDLDETARYLKRIARYYDHASRTATVKET